MNREDETLVSRLAEEKGVGVVSLRMAWRQALERLVGAGIRGEVLERFVRELPHARLGLGFAAWIGSHSGDRVGLVKRMMEEAGDEGYSLGEWMEGLEAFYSWAEAQCVTASIEGAHGYVTCCAAAAAARKPAVPLPDAVREMLETHGYAGESR